MRTRDPSWHQCRRAFLHRDRRAAPAAPTASSCRVSTPRIGGGLLPGRLLEARPSRRHRPRPSSAPASRRLRVHHDLGQPPAGKRDTLVKGRSGFAAPRSRSAGVRFGLEVPVVLPARRGHEPRSRLLPRALVPAHRRRPCELRDARPRPDPSESPGFGVTGGVPRGSPPAPRTTTPATTSRASACTCPLAGAAEWLPRRCVWRLHVSSRHVPRRLARRAG